MKNEECLERGTHTHGNYCYSVFPCYFFHVLLAFTLDKNNNNKIIIKDSFNLVSMESPTNARLQKTCPAIHGDDMETPIAAIP